MIWRSKSSIYIYKLAIILIINHCWNVLLDVSFKFLPIILCSGLIIQLILSTFIISLLHLREVIFMIVLHFLGHHYSCVFYILYIFPCNAPVHFLFRRFFTSLKIFCLLTQVILFYIFNLYLTCMFIHFADLFVKFCYERFHEKRLSMPHKLCPIISLK